MTTVRKRIGGGWKNVQIAKTDGHDSEIWYKELEDIGKQEQVFKTAALKCNLKLPTDLKEEIESNVTSEIDVSENSSEQKEYNVTVNKEAEHKLQMDALATEKTNGQSAEITAVIKHQKEIEKEASTFDGEPAENGVKEITHDTDDPFYLPGIESSESTFTYGHSKGTTSDSNLKSGSFANYADYPILKRVQDNVIGHDLVINTPYGQRKLTYCDYTASGRCLSFIEDFIRVNVIPTYANTHSSTGHNARQTGKYMEEARTTIKRCVNASKDDVVIFTGSGATAGMHKLAWALKMNNQRIASETAVFIGPYEHHSNILLWREFGTKVR